MRLGAIAYINTLPIYHGLALDQVGPSASLHYGQPTWLNEQSLSLALDLTPVSMSHYLAHREQLLLVPGLSVSSFGGVDSVLFVSRHDWSPQSLLSLAEIPVPDSSASSIALLAWLMQQVTGESLRHRFRVYPAGQLQQALMQAGCALTIGDEALLFQQSAQANGWQCHDLATLWRAATGLPFVFAVWVTPRALAIPSEQIQQAMTVLQTNLSLNQRKRQRWSDLLETALESCPLPCIDIDHYLTRSLDYGWSPAHQASIERFSQMVGSPIKD